MKYFMGIDIGTFSSKVPLLLNVPISIPIKY